MPNRDDRYRIDLAPVARCTFSEVFGTEPCRRDGADQTLWDFIRARCRVEEIELENPGDDLEWLMPIEIPELTPEEEERIRREMNPDGKEFLTFQDFEDLAERERVDFSSVASIRLSEVFGQGETTDAELSVRFRSFITERNLEIFLPPRKDA